MNGEELLAYKLVNEFKRLNAFQNLQNLNVDFVDYLADLATLGVFPKKFSEFSEDSSGFFYNDKGKFLVDDFSRLVSFDEVYAENGNIKFIRRFDVMGDDHTVIKDIYAFENIETVVEYDSFFFNAYLDEDSVYPRLFLNRDLLDEIDKIRDSSDSFRNLGYFGGGSGNNDLDDDSDDDDDDDSDEEYSVNNDILIPMDTEGLIEIYQRRFSQNRKYLLKDMVGVNFSHDSLSNIDLYITNYTGLLLADNYKVSANPILALNTKMNFKDVVALDDLLADGNIGSDDLLHFISDIFKNDEVVVSDMNNKLKYTDINNGIKLLNILEKKY